jgi:hypothetical protein
LKAKHPENHKKNNTIICLPYDIDEVFSFYCARYKDLSMKEFLRLGLSDFLRKLRSIPEQEPLYKIIQSRVIDISKIKDKEERKYWRNLKRVNRIPDIYLSNEELDNNLKSIVKNIGGLNGKGFN